MTEANFSLPHAQEHAGFETRCLFFPTSPEAFTEKLATWCLWAPTVHRINLTSQNLTKQANTTSSKAAQQLRDALLWHKRKLKNTTDTFIFCRKVPGAGHSSFTYGIYVPRSPCCTLSWLLRKSFTPSASRIHAGISRNNQIRTTRCNFVYASSLTHCYFLQNSLSRLPLKWDDKFMPFRLPCYTPLWLCNESTRTH